MLSLSCVNDDVLCRLSLRNNQFEDTPIQLIGEGYEEEVTIDNVRGQLDWTSEEELMQSDANEEISGELLGKILLVL